MSKSKGQSNLVPNSSFENYISCPTSDSQLFLATPWVNPNTSTPDYFNACNGGIVGVPINIGGIQNARTGNAYAGFYAFNGFDFQEYIQVKLIDTLDANRRYCVSFYVSIPEIYNLSVNNIGALLTDTPISSTTNTYFPYTPQIENPISNPLTSKTNWMMVSGTFIAIGNELYLTIGNFNSDNNSDTVGLGNFPFSCYYYIDDVTVIECIDTITPEEPLIIPNIFTPNGDGQNDLLEIKGLEKGDKLTIYNRWGTKVFYSINEQAYWDGYTTSGEPCSQGTYFYTIDLINGERKSGYVQLQR